MGRGSLRPMLIGAVAGESSTPHNSTSLPYSPASLPPPPHLSLLPFMPPLLSRNVRRSKRVYRRLAAGAVRVVPARKGGWLGHRLRRSQRWRVRFGMFHGGASPNPFSISRPGHGPRLAGLGARRYAYASPPVGRFAAAFPHLTAAANVSAADARRAAYMASLSRPQRLAIAREKRLAYLARRSDPALMDDLLALLE